MTVNEVRSSEAPRELLQKAVLLLGSDASRNDGLRLTAKAALIQGATRLALDVTAELGRRPGRLVEDYCLRAQALTLAGHFEAALKTTRRLAQTAETLSAASIAHMLLGETAEALRCARDALAQGTLGVHDQRKLQWLAAYASALLGERSRRGLAARWSGTPKCDNSTIILGILDYKTPDIDRNSINIGDWMQTLAALRHLARLRNVDWTFDDPGLKPLLKRLQETWQKDEQIPCRGQKAHIAVVDRDFPLSASIRFPKKKIWLIANGWYSTLVFGNTRAWPTPTNIEPVLLSIHLSKPSDLTEDRLNWLQAHGPVGCRDRATERWLTNQGVRAYFSGCLTMTLDSIARAEPKSGEKLGVDAEVEDPSWIELTHHIPSLRSVSCSEALAMAEEYLARYARSKQIRTNRLHCALPARAVGASCDFVPKVASDRRFDGLADLDERSFTEIKHALCKQMAEVLRLIMEGASPEIVRAAQPQRRIAKPSKKPRVRDLESIQRPSELTVALSFDENYRSHTSVLLASIRRTTQLPLRLVLLTRGTTVPRELSLICQPFEVRAFDMEGRLAGVRLGLDQQTTISTMDRLFLPELIMDLDRIVYLDCDTLVREDLGELASFGTGRTGVAAKRLHGPVPVNLAQLIERRAQHLSPESARRLRIWGSENADLAAPCFNAGVLVLSLDTMRKIDLAETALSLIREFGLHDQEALNLATKGQASLLPTNWNAIAPTDHCLDPKLIHWTGRNKPWAAKPVKFGTEWKALREQLDSGAADLIER